MKRALLLAMVLLLTVMPAALSQSEPPAASPAPEAAKSDEALIRATGTFKAALPADIAVLTLSTRASGSTVTDAQNAAKALLDGLQSALLERGVTPEDIQTTFYNVETVYSYQYSKLGEQEKPSGYDVTANLVARVRNLNSVGEMIDAAVSAGAESTYELTFESSAYQDAYSAALASATADAMSKAKLLAQSSGLTLGKLRSVTELANTKDDYTQTADYSGAMEDRPQYHTLAIVATVEVCYAAE